MAPAAPVTATEIGDLFIFQSLNLAPGCPRGKRKSRENKWTSRPLMAHDRVNDNSKDSWFAFTKGLVRQRRAARGGWLAGWLRPFSRAYFSNRGRPPALQCPRANGQGRRWHFGRGPCLGRQIRGIGRHLRAVARTIQSQTDGTW